MTRVAEKILHGCVYSMHLIPVCQVMRYGIRFSFPQFKYDFEKIYCGFRENHDGY